MVSIKLLDSSDTKYYTLLIDNTVVSIKNRMKDFSLLEKFIVECEQLLINQDIETIPLLCNKYGPDAPHIFMDLVINIFKESFYQCFNKFGNSYLEKGEHYSYGHFYRFIFPSKINSLRFYSGFMKEAMSNFDNEIALPYLRKAFNQRSKLKVHKAYKTLRMERFFKITLEKLPHHYLESYLNFCAERHIKDGKKISFTKLYNLAFYDQLLKQYFDTKQFFFVKGVVDYWKQNELKIMEDFQMKIGSSLWIIPYLDIQVYRLKRFNFYNINNLLKSEIQEYLISFYKKGESIKGFYRRYQNLIRVAFSIQEVAPDCTSFLHLQYAEVLQIYENLKQSKDNMGDHLYSLKTLQGSFSEVRLLFDSLKVKNSKESLSNPFRQFKFNNINSFVKNAEFIPQEVINQLAVAIKECPNHVKTIWLIMMNTGLRISEVLSLTEDCLVYNKTEHVYYLKYLSPKTLKQRRRKGLDDYSLVPLLSSEVVELIRYQIQITKHLRYAGKFKYIFIRDSNSQRLDDSEIICRYSSSDISSVINNCIKKYNVKDNEGNLWHYSHHQCRKTLAVNLLSEGSSISEVGEILGHMEEKTTLQYYQDIDNMKIAKLDQELFEKIFDSIDKETKKAYTPIELEQLKNEIMTGARETPEGHGSCVKHVSFGPCKKRSCVGCSLLLTGPQKLPLWEKLYSEQKKYIDDLVFFMQKQGITDYESYRDYQAELHLLKLYENTIIKINKFLKEV